MIVDTFPAPIGFVQEFLVVANDLTMKSVEVTEGALNFAPKFPRRRDAEGLLRRISKRLHIVELVDHRRRFHYANFDINQDRLEQLIDLRGWPEITRNRLNVTLETRWGKNEGWWVELSLTCEEVGD